MAKREEAIELLKAEREIIGTNQNIQEENPMEEEEFSMVHNQDQVEDMDEIEKWISYPNKNLDDHPTMKKMYVKYNTILASQASVERIFSFAKLVLGLRRGSLGDENFEKQLVMKANRVMNPKLFEKKN